MERKSYCDYLRIIATFAVVMLHVAAFNWHSSDVNGAAWQSFNFYDSICRWAVPMFVMISGSLFLNRETPLRKIYGKYVLRMVTAFAAWSFFYVLTSEDAIEKGVINGFRSHTTDLLNGHYHMWFLLMIIGLYICIPFYKKIVEDRNIMKYFLLLSFLFAALIPWIICLLNDYVAVSSDDIAKATEIAHSHLSTMGIQMVLGYGFYFVLGYYLDSIELNKKQRIIIYILGIAGFAFTVLVDLDIALKTQEPCSHYYWEFNVNVLLEAICMHTLFKYRNYRNTGSRPGIIALSGYTFGAFLIHPFFIEKCSAYLGFDTLSFNALIAVPVVTVSVFVCAMISSAIMNRIPVIRKYIV